MRRILLLLTDLKIGGTPTVVRELAFRLKHEKNLTVHVACLAGPGPLGDELASHQIPVTALGAAGPWDVGAILRLGRLIRENRFDTVFSFLVHANAAAAIVSRGFGESVRFLQSIQTTQPKPHWHWLVQTVAANAAEKIVVPSPSVAAVARDWADVPAEKIVVIPNAVDPAEFSAIHPAGGKRIGFIGRLDPIKRIGDLIKAVALLPDATLHIFGEGSERDHLQSLVGQLTLDHRITFHGPVRRAADALATIDLLTLPSSAEGFGLVLIEAMAAGIPVVATDVAGIRDVVEHGRDGLLVPPGDPPALAAAIQMIFSDPVLRERLTSAGWRNVMGRFTWDQVLPRYWNLLGLS